MEEQSMTEEELIKIERLATAQEAVAEALNSIAVNIDKLTTLMVYEKEELKFLKCIQEHLDHERKIEVRTIPLRKDREEIIAVCDRGDKKCFRLRVVDTEKDRYGFLTMFVYKSVLGDNYEKALGILNQRGLRLTISGKIVWSPEDEEKGFKGGWTIYLNSIDNVSTAKKSPPVITDTDDGSDVPF